MGDSIKDSRFSHIGNDPRFKTIPRSQRQVKIDKRFQSMFKDKRFKIKYTVDKRGRPISRTSNEDLERYYALSSGSSDSEDEGSPRSAPSAPVKPGKKTKLKIEQTEPESPESAESEDEADVADKSKFSDDESEEDVRIRSDDEKITDKVKSKLKDMSVDYARGEGAILSDSSSSDEESSDDEANTLVEHEWGELDKDADRTEEITSRLAVCNMDWDRIRAVDLMVLLNSFIPPGGIVQRVTIYPSDFGLQRMKKEEEEGPTELVKQSSKIKDVGDTVRDSIGDNNVDSDDSADDDISNETSSNENEEGSSYHMEKLRKYQLNRLKYFYAVVECDSPNTANHIYSECDGMEYESSATRLDLRFVPDETKFDQEPRETCTGMPDATKYRPRHFTTTALQQAKVELTWDETDPNRTEIANRLLAGDSVDDKDLQAYLACSSGEEEEEEGVMNGSHKGKKDSGLSRTEKIKDKSKIELSSEDEGSDDEDPITKYRLLLHGIEEEEKEKKNKDVHMEISWGLGLKEKAEEAVKKHISSSKELTPFQEMMEKRKQKLQEKRKEKSLKKMQKSAGEAVENLLSDDDIPSDVDMNDPYFAEEFKDFKSNPKKVKSKKKSKTGEGEEDQQQKAELELLLLEKDEPNHFNFKKIQEEESGNQSKRKRKAKQRKEKNDAVDKTADDNFQMDVNDRRFSAVFSSHHFNIDPTDPHFRKTNAMEALISAKQRRLADTNQALDHSRSSPQTKKLKADTELSRLVKSVKNNAQRMKRT